MSEAELSSKFDPQMAPEHGKDSTNTLLGASLYIQAEIEGRVTHSISQVITQANTSTVSF